MTKIRHSLLKDVVSVETLVGTGSHGSLYSEATVCCHVDLTRRLVRDADGREVVSEMTLELHPDDEALFTPGSKVTFGARTSTVLAVSPQSFRGYTVLLKVACS